MEEDMEDTEDGTEAVIEAETETETVAVIVIATDEAVVEEERRAVEVGEAKETNC